MLEIIISLVPLVLIIFVSIVLVDLYILVRKLILLKIKFYSKQLNKED